MTDPTDRCYEQILVLRCKAGDDAAFTELVERYSPRLRYYLRKMLDQPESADDALQEIWLDVFLGLPKLADSLAFPAWIYRVARNRCALAWRKRDRAHRLVAELQSFGESDEEQEPEFNAEDAVRVHGALDELAPEHREVLVLRFLQDMSYEDVAKTIGCQLGTVRSRLHYAKRALRHALEMKPLL
jgi:RNA polymerase sigma-70 factor (ECF subfamily)